MIYSTPAQDWRLPTSSPTHGSQCVFNLQMFAMADAVQKCTRNSYRHKVCCSPSLPRRKRIACVFKDLANGIQRTHWAINTLPCGNGECFVIDVAVVIQASRCPTMARFHVFTLFSFPLWPITPNGRGALLPPVSLMCLQVRTVFTSNMSCRLYCNGMSTCCRVVLLTCQLSSQEASCERMPCAVRSKVFEPGSGYLAPSCRQSACLRG